MTSEPSALPRSAPKRWTWALLLAGLLLAMIPLRAAWPVEQSITLRLRGGRQEVRAIEAQVLPRGAAMEESLKSIRWQFPSGAPPRLSSQVSIPSGDWDLLLTVEATTGARTLRQPITLAGQGVEVDLPVVE